MSKPVIRTSSIIRMTSMILPVVILSKVFGMLRSMLLAGKLGLGAEASAYTIARTLVLALMVLSSCFLTTAFLPIYSRAKAQGGKPAADRYASITLTFFIFASLITAALLYLTLPAIISVIAAGYDAPTQALVVRLTRILLPMLPVQCVSYLMTAVLNANDDFVLPHIATMSLSFALIPMLILVPSGDPVHLAVMVSIATTASAVLEVAIQLPIAVRRVSLRPIFQPRDPLLLQTMTVALPAVVAAPATELNQILQNSLSSYLDPDAVSALAYGYNTYTIFIGVFVLPVTIILFSHLSALAAKDDHEQMIGTLRRYLETMLLVLLPLIVFTMLLHKDIIGLLYQRGEFLASDTLLTGSALLFFMPGLLGYAVKDIFSRFFFTLQDTRTPMFVGIGSLGVNFALNYALIGPMGIAGLALASSITLLLSALTLALLLKRKTGGLQLRPIVGDTVRIVLVATACAGLSALASHLLAGQGMVIRLLLAGGIPMVIYIFTVLALRVTSAQLLTGEVLRMMRRGRKEE